LEGVCRLQALAKVFGTLRIECAMARRALERGSRLHFDIVEPERARIECVITLCTPPQCAAWINHVSGYTMQQCVLFEPYVGGGTKVTTWIELTQAGLGPDAPKVRFVLKSLLQTWFGNFTAECDHRARAADYRSNADSCSHPD
jgi:hypothetical protein